MDSRDNEVRGRDKMIDDVNMRWQDKLCVPATGLIPVKFHLPNLGLSHGLRSKLMCNGS